MSYQQQPFLFSPPVRPGELEGIFRPPSKGKAVPRGPAKSAWEMRRIGEKDTGTRETVRVMAELAQAGAMHPGLLVDARRAVRNAGLASKDYAGELEAVFDYVRNNVRYVLDPRAYEYVQHPAWTLYTDGQGDCDDSTTLIGALAMQLGHGFSIRTIRADPSRPDEFSHVYALVGYRDKDGVHWFAADPTHPRPEDATFGWEAPEGMKWGTEDLVVAPA